MGTLEGYLDCSMGEVQNMVGSGVLPQDGVHLTRLLYSNDEAIDWDPGGFPNLIYRTHLESNGLLFCANIANTGKIVLMGLKTVEEVYEAYRMMCKVVHDFDDPNTPTDPKERHRYRMRQLESDPRFIREADAGVGVAADMEHIGDEYGAEPMDEDDDRMINLFVNGVATTSAVTVAPVKQEPGTKQKTFIEEDDDNDEEPLLFQAIRTGQINNVKFILGQEGMRDAIWIPGTNKLAVLEMLDAVPVERIDQTHLQIRYLIESHLESVSVSKKTEK